MASCKDCLHVEACNGILNGFDIDIEFFGEQVSVCKNFKDRPRFVELPCKLGDFVYFIKARRVMADVVSKFTIDRRGVMLQRANGYNLGYIDQLGKKLFLTCEEAEQALKERESE